MANIENNKLQLLPHQEEAYENVEELFNEKGKAAVIFPTGCGKSFVTLKYILEYPDDRILFLSPRNAIKDQMYEYVVRYIGGDSRPTDEIIKEYGNLRLAAKQYIPNIECMLYQTVLGIGEKDSVDNVINELKPDIIIVDEMHHLKTKGTRNNVTLDESDETVVDEEEINQENKWGEKFNQLLEMNPQAKLLGLSATPIRTDGANVVERIFEDSVASEISLLEAMEQGIIYPPNYIVPDFIREDELKSLLEKIESAEGSKKEELKQLYDELVKKSAEAPGIPALLQEHITEKDGKYIIFCKDIADMQEKMEKAQEWFGKIDEEPEIYGIHSKDKTSAQQLENFNNSKSEHLKLMFCVGMIDEGVHLNDISGVILAAKTGSRPTYLQRLGRAISSGENKKQALVIDLVNNNEILQDKGKVQNGYEINDLEALQKLIDWIEKCNDGALPEFLEEKSFKEQTMAKRLARINNKYLKYANDENLLNELSEHKQKEIMDIIELGKSIGMFEELIEIEDENDQGINYSNNFDKFLDNIEIKGVRKEFREFLESKIKDTAFEKVIEFAEENGRLPKAFNKKVAEMTEDERKEANLYARWLKSEEKKIADEYAGQDIEQVPEKYREIVKNLRKYNYGLEKETTAFEKVIEFAKENGRLPKAFNKKVAEMTETEKKETYLYARWIKSEEKKIADEYAGQDIEQVPEEYREIVKNLRKYNYGLEKEMTAFEKVIEFAKENGRLPKQIIKKVAEMTEDERKEANLYARWLKLEEKKIADEYAGQDIEQVPEEHREIVKNLRKYNYGLEKEMTAFEKVIEFAKKNGRLPKAKKVEEMTEDERKERNLYAKWLRTEEKKVADKYAGQDLKQVPEEYREIVKNLRKYNYGLEKEMTAFEKVIEFAKENGRLPKAKKVEEMTEDEKDEHNLYRNWSKTEEKKMADEYAGQDLEQVPEEYRSAVEILRKYGYGLKKNKTAYENLIEFYDTNGRLPMSIKKITTKKERDEYNTYSNWIRSKEKKIADEYAGQDLKQIPEEHREIVETLRNCGYMGTKPKSTKEMAQTIKDVPAAEVDEAIEFLNSITKSKENEKDGDEHNDD